MCVSRFFKTHHRRFCKENARIAIAFSLTAPLFVSLAAYYTYNFHVCLKFAHFGWIACPSRSIVSPCTDSKQQKVVAYSCLEFFASEFSILCGLPYIGCTLTRLKMQRFHFAAATKNVKPSVQWQAECLSFLPCMHLSLRKYIIRNIFQPRLLARHIRWSEMLSVVNQNFPCTWLAVGTFGQAIARPGRRTRNASRLCRMPTVWIARKASHTFVQWKASRASSIQLLEARNTHAKNHSILWKSQGVETASILHMFCILALFQKPLMAI